MAENHDAFPRPYSRDEIRGETHWAQNGMSLRDYFAAHAPRRPQQWFEPVLTSPEPTPVYECSGSHEHKYASPYDAHEVCQDTNQSARDAWRQERDKQRLIQWPYAWADTQIAARERA